MAVEVLTVAPSLGQVDEAMGRRGFDVSRLVTLGTCAIRLLSDADVVTVVEVEGEAEDEEARAADTVLATVEANAAVCSFLNRSIMTIEGLSFGSAFGALGLAGAAGRSAAESPEDPWATRCFFVGMIASDMVVLLFSGLRFLTSPSALLVVVAWYS